MNIFCEVIPFRKVGSLSRLTYASVIKQQKVQVGDVVEIPLRGKREQGIVSSVFSEYPDPDSLKTLGRIVSSQLYSSAQIQQLQKVAEYFFVHEGVLYEKGIPKSIQNLHYALPTQEWVMLDADNLYTKSVNGRQQQKLIDFLSEKEGQRVEHVVLKKYFSSAVIKAVQEKNLLTKVIKPKYLFNSFSPHLSEKKDEKNFLKQEIYVGSVYSGRFLKEVEWIQNHMKHGQVLILFPDEFSLISGVKLFGTRFESLDVWTSSASSKKMHDLFWKIATGNTSLVFGLQNSLFLPFAHLSGIAVFESSHYGHVSRFPPYFNTEDIVKKYTENTHISVLFSSVSGTVQKNQNIRYFPSPKQYQTHCYDMKEELQSGGDFSILSEMMFSKIQKRLDRKELSVLYLNRKGVHSSLICSKCGWSPVSPFSGNRLTVFEHHGKKMLRCTHSKYTEYFYDTCKKCSSPLRGIGEGAQFLEQVLRERFPSSRIVRVDGDSAFSFAQIQQLQADITEKKVDIVLGTQLMLSMGMLENATLACDVLSDNAFSFPHFLAEERFLTNTALLTNMLSSSPHSELVLQTFDPNHSALHSALHTSFSDWYSKEYSVRQSLQYPPFSQMITVYTVGKDQNLLQKKIEEYAKNISDGVIKSFPLNAVFIPHHNQYRMEKTLMLPMDFPLPPAKGIAFRRGE